MEFSPRRLRELEEMCDYLDQAWQEWQAAPRYHAEKEAEELEMFLLIQEAFASSIERAYIDAWRERCPRTNNSGPS